MKESPRDRLDLAAYARLRAYFTGEIRVPAAYLFGSRACGTFTDNSDVDVAVILGPGLDAEQAFWECAKIKNALEVMFRPIQVDVLDLERIPCRIAHEVLKSGSWSRRTTRADVSKSSCGAGLSISTFFPGSRGLSRWPWNARWTLGICSSR